VNHEQWLKAQARYEAGLARIVRKYFSDQGVRLAATIRTLDGLSVADVPFILGIETEQEKLREALHLPLAKIMAAGAMAIIQQRKDFDFFEAEISASAIGFELPEIALDGIRRHLTELESAPYWERIQATSGRRLAGILDEGLTEGWSPWKIAKEVRGVWGGKEFHRRALGIARTESTGALNAGQDAGAVEAEQAGVLLSKQWSTNMDGDERPDHAAAHMQVAPGGAEGMFTVGGYPTPFPGHWSLPAEQRIRCRCGVLYVPMGEPLAVDLGELF